MCVKVMPPITRVKHGPAPRVWVSLGLHQCRAGPRCLTGAQLGSPWKPLLMCTQNRKNGDKSGLKHALNWKTRRSLIGSVSAQRHLLALVWTDFLLEKREEAQFYLPPEKSLFHLVPREVFPSSKTTYAPADHSSAGLRVRFYVQKRCQTMKVNVLFQNGPWLMRTKGRTFRPIFPCKARNRRAVNSFCFPAILLVSLIALLHLWWFQASQLYLKNNFCLTH